MIPRTAVIALLCAQAALATSTVLGKVVADSGLHASFLCVRFSIAFVLICILAHYRNRHSATSLLSAFAQLTKMEWARLLLQGFLGGYLFNTLFLVGMGHTTATSAGIISSTLPAFIALFACLFLKESIRPRQWMSIGMCIGGILVISLNNFQGTADVGGTWLGDGIILFAMLPEAWFAILSRQVGRSVPPILSTLVVLGSSAIMFMPEMCLQAPQLMAYTFTPIELMCWIGSGVACVIFFGAFSYALSQASASQAAVFGGASPVFTAALATVFLGEHFGVYELVGTLLVATAIVLGAYRNKRPTTEVSPAPIDLSPPDIANP